MRVETVEPGEKQTQGISHQCKMQEGCKVDRLFQWCTVTGPEAMDMKEAVKWEIFFEYHQGTVRVTKHWNV